MLVHGAGGSHLSWPPELRRWPGSPVYAIDLPGHGRSGGQSESTLSGYAERLLDWIRRQELPPLVLMGHSMGGAIGLTMALRSPQRVAGLAFVGSSARLRVAPTILELSSEMKTFPQAVDFVIRAAFSPAADQRLVALTKERMRESGHGVFHNDFQACDHFDVRQRLHEIKKPAIVLTGEDDQLTPAKLGKELAEGLPAGRFVSIPAAGHMAMLEQPAKVQAAVEAFYTDHFQTD